MYSLYWRFCKITPVAAPVLSFQVNKIPARTGPYRMLKTKKTFLKKKMTLKAGWWTKPRKSLLSVEYKMI